MKQKNSFLSYTVGPVMLALGMMLAFFSPVAAQAPGDEPQPPTGQETVKVPVERMEKQYQRQLERLDAQATRLEKTDEIIADVEKRIADLAAKGKDVSALEEALGNYQASVDEAVSLHATAETILQTHDGFDADGKVVDAQAAAVTLREASNAMNDVQRLLRPALRDLLQALRDFRRDNR